MLERQQVLVLSTLSQLVAISSEQNQNFVSQRTQQNKFGTPKQNIHTKHASDYLRFKMLKNNKTIKVLRGLYCIYQEARFFLIIFTKQTLE